MDRPNLPLNALRAFEVSARQGSFTQAAIELRVSQAAVSHQVNGLEELLGVKLFTRTPKGLLLTDEAVALFPVVTESLERIGDVLDRFLDGRYRETLHLGVVTTFAVGWLLPRLDRFNSAHPGIDLRISTNNNRVDIPREGLQMAIRFGAGHWNGIEAVPLMETPLTPLCAPGLAARISNPAALADHILFRSYRGEEWPGWFRAVGLPCPDLRGPVFDSSVAMADLAEAGMGVAILPSAMFADRVASGRLVRLFETEIVTGRYWLTRVAQKPPSPAMRQFEEWILKVLKADARAGQTGSPSFPAPCRDPMAGFGT